MPRNCQDWTLNTPDLAACQLHSDAWKGNPEAPPGRRRAAAALLRSVLGPEGFPPHFRQRQVWFYLFLCNCWWQNSQKRMQVLVYHPAAPGCCWVIVSESHLWLEDKFSSFGGQKQWESGQLLNHFCTEKSWISTSPRQERSSRRRFCWVLVSWELRALCKPLWVKLLPSPVKRTLLSCDIWFPSAENGTFNQLDFIFKLLLDASHN